MDILEHLPKVDTTAAASGLRGALQGADAEAELVRGVLDHQLTLTRRSTKAAAFLFAFGLVDVRNDILELRRYHSRPRGLVQALESTSLKAFMSKLEVKLGQ